MKLRILFFPLALIVAVSVSIWLTKPEFGVIKEKKLQVEKQKKILDSLEKKQQQLRVYIGKLESNKADEELILDYIPKLRQEENIFSKINWIAGETKMALLNMSLSEKNPKESAKKSSKQASSAAAAVDSEAGAKAVTEGEVFDKNSIVVQIDVSGEYENIKNFIDQLRSMEKFNDIASIDISRQEETGEEGERKVVKAPNQLAATINAEFEYWSVVSATRDTVIPEEIDFEAGKKVKNLVKVKIPPVTADDAGRKNVFLPY